MSPTFYPDIDTIANLKVKPTTGEYFILNFLKDNLEDDYEIYFQPMLDWDFPDIIIMRKWYWIRIIEVKDWDLSHYKIEEETISWRKILNWKLQKNWSKILSPIEQVNNYKDNVYNIHIDHLLLEYQIKKWNEVYGLIKTMVYFYNETPERINKFFGNKSIWGYVEIISGKWLNKNCFDLNIKNDYFDEKLYTEFQRILKPSYHTIEQWIQIEYTPKQIELSQSKSVEQKIKWVAWSWKTLILAKRAANALKRIDWRILILTFNITLKNYIHDNISKVRENFSWDRFYISNYHNFIKSQANNYNIKINNFSDFDNVNLFDDCNDSIDKYDCILIDEIQDYKTNWIDLIKNNFLRSWWEFVVFWDEKQNIYNRELDKDKNPNTRIIWAWSRLNQSFRLSTRIADLAYEFQKCYFTWKYQIESIEVSSQISLYLENETLNYINLPKDTEFSLLINNVKNIIKEYWFHNNDICFLSSKINILREIDYALRYSKFVLHTKTNFETKEIFDQILIQNAWFPKKITTWLKSIRKNKKIHFWMNDGNMKLSTIHSFKWCEIPTLFLILTEDDANDELIYTAITRARFNLIIVNLWNKKYDEFFTTKLTKIVPKIVQQESSPIEWQRTINSIVSQECSMRDILSFLRKWWNKFKIGIIWEMAVSNRDLKDALANYFIKEGVWWNQWDIDFISNKEMKQKDCLKQFRIWWTSYSLIITWQIHHHSLKWNESANLLEELNKDKYIPHIVGSNPKDKLSINNFLDILDQYLKEKLKLLNNEISKIDTI